MSKKDFMRGVETVAKANADFMRKQAAATEELGKRIIQKIDDQGKIIDVILDNLNSQEKKELYELQSAYDIADLGQNEKEMLASYLLTLISKYGQDSENQKDYYFAVKKHMEVTDVSPDFNLYLVENIDSKAETRAVFQTVCEFLFLKTGDFSFFDEFEEELEAFELSKKVIKEIVATLETVYNALGLRGIVEHYIPAEAEPAPEHYGLVVPLEGELVFDDSNRDVPIGTEQVYENLRIHIPKQLHIDGKAVFKNCEIVLDYNGSYTIVVREKDSEIEFIDCEFITKKKAKVAAMSIVGKCFIKDCLFNGLDYKYGISDEVLEDNDGESVDYNLSFLDIDGYDRPAELKMEHCRIEGCEGTFVNADGNAFGNCFNVVIDNCFIENHTGNFLLARYADDGNKTGIKVTNSMFKNISKYEQEDDWDFKIDNFTSLMKVADTTFLCEGNVFENIEEDTIAVSRTLSTCTSDILNNKFTNCKQNEPLEGTIRNCEFSEMKSISFGNCGAFNNDIVIVADSTFDKIDGIIKLEYGKIEHCTFTDSTVTVEIEGKPKGNDRYTCEANDLTFKNCRTIGTKGYSFEDTPCFLQAKSYLDKDGVCVIFNGCKFENCLTSGNYINTQKKIWGAFERIKVIVVGREYNTSVR